MANQVVNRQVNIFIESGQAQKAFDALKKKEKELQEQLEKATDPKTIARLKTEIEKLQEPIDRASKKLSGELSPSFRDVQSTVNSLGNRLKRMSEEDADFTNVLQQYRQANVELEQQKGKVGALQKAMQSFWQQAKTVAVGVVIGNTIQTALQTVLGYVTGIVTGSAKISDELADIQRITGLQKNEVKELNSELKKIDTRTSTSALRDITIVAGKLGIEGKENLLSFVTAVDKLNIAMGGELGDINAFTTDLGKILNVFEGKITGENITAVGNAIVDLANKGVASGPFIVDFTQRVAGIAKTSNLSLEAVIGLAAGLEESGQKVESSSTAITKILTDIANDVPKAAKTAGVEVEKFNKLFAEQPQEALLLYAQGLVKNKQSFAEVTAAFKDNGEEGARVISTLAAIGQNTDFFRDKIVTAGNALKDTTAITAAFELKNNTAGAELDKFKKNFASLFQSSSFQEAGNAAIGIINAFINGLRASFQFINEHRVLIGTLAAIYLLLTKATEGATLANLKNAVVTRVKIALAALERTAIAASVAAQLTYGAIVDLVTGKIKLATAAQRIWSAVTSLGAGPLGVLLVAVGGLIIGLQSLFSRTKALTAEQKLQNELAKKTSEILGDQVANVERMAKAAANENLVMGERKKAIEDLIKINPAFADTLRINAQGHLEGVAAIAAYIKALNEKAEAEAKTSLLTEKIRRKNEIINQARASVPQLAGFSDEEILKAASGNVIRQIFAPARELNALTEQINSLNEQIAKAANKAAALGKDGSDAVKGDAKEVGDSIDSLKKKLEELQKQRDASTSDAQRKKLNADIDALEKRIAEMEGKANAAATKAESDIEKLKKELQKIKEDLSLSTLSFLEKELGQLDFKYQKLADRAKGNNKLLLLIQDLYQQDRLRVIREASRKEIEEWDKQNDKGLKKQEQTLKKSHEWIIEFTQRFQEDFNKATDVAIDRHDRSRIAGDELAVIRARGKEKLQAELKLLDDQEAQELQKKDLTENEKFLIEEKFRQKRLEAEAKFDSDVLERFANRAQELLNIDQIFADIKTQRENDELARDQRVNDKKKASLEKRLKAGTLSQLNYDREVAKIDKEREKKQHEIEVRQFRRKQKADIAQALINGLLAVAMDFRTIPKFIPGTIIPNPELPIAIAIDAAVTAAKVGAIASQKAPELGTGGKLSGPSHQDKSKGMPVSDPYTGRIHAYMEGGEGVVNKTTMNDAKRYNIEGTPSQIISWLNGMHGVSWASGAIVRPSWSTAKPAQMNFKRINESITTIRRFYASGGEFNASATIAPAAKDDSVNNLAMVVANLQASTELMAATIIQLQKNGISASVSLSDLEKQKARLDAIRKDATL